MMGDFGSGPIILVADQESKRRLKGYEAQKANMLAAIQVADIVRTSFGPRGMDKIIVGPDGDVTISNDGATILKMMPVEHECAKLLVDLSKSQDDEVGDGTTGVVVLAGALLKQALKLLEKKVHPLRIADGFEMACQLAIKHCEEVSASLTLEEDVMRRVAITALCSKVVSSRSAELADLCVKAVLSVADLSRSDVNFDLIKVEGKPGGKLEDTRLIEGIALNKDFSHSQMAKEVINAKIAILTCPFEPPKPKTKHKLSIRNPEAYNELVLQEQKYFSDMVEKVRNSGANVVLCQWGFDDEANHLLLRHNLPAVRWVGGQEIELLSLATGGRIVPRFEDLAPHKLGTAARVAEVSIGTEDERMIIIEGCPKGKAVTILVRGGNAMVISEAKRSIHDALCSIRNLITDNRILPGGGAVETACALKIIQESKYIDSLEQHAVEAFGEALLTIPEALAENSGLDSINTIGNLKAKHTNTTNHNFGVDPTENVTGISDMMKKHVYETLNSKTHQLALATQVNLTTIKILLAGCQNDFENRRYHCHGKSISFCFRCFWMSLFSSQLITKRISFAVILMPRNHVKCLRVKSVEVRRVCLRLLNTARVHYDFCCTGTKTLL